jgi:hypothetical protein
MRGRWARAGAQLFDWYGDGDTPNRVAVAGDGVWLAP